MSARAVVFAYHDVGVRCLSVLLEQGVDVALVVTHPDDPAENVWFGNVAALARSRGLDVAMPDDPNDEAFAARVRHLAPDFLFSFYYRRVLSPALLAAAARGAFNLHGSLLPKFRGRAPVNWAILHGAAETGATLHEMVAKPDAGRIAGQQAVPIGDDDTATEVFARVTDAAERVLRAALPGLLDGTLALQPQDLRQGSYFGGRKPEDGRIDWRWPARQVHDLIRAVAPPYPGAFGPWEGGMARILRSTWAEPPTDLAAEGEPGTVQRRGERLFVRCGDGRWLELLQVDVMGQFPP